MATPKTVAVIGAGPAGLTTTRSMLSEGLLPTIFDSKLHVGGLWSERSPFTSNSLGLNPEMRTNISHFCCSFSDLSWCSVQPDAKIFPKACELRRYLEEYRKKFIDEKYLMLGCDVIEILRKGDGKWSIKWTTPEKDMECREFDFVAVCSGFFSRAYIPPLRQIDMQEMKSALLEDGKEIGMGGKPLDSLAVSQLSLEPQTPTRRSTRLAIRQISSEAPSDLDQDNRFSKFSGKIVHTSEYSTFTVPIESPPPNQDGNIKKQKVVVVGGSMSGAEVAADLALRVSSLPEKDRDWFEIIHLFSRPFWIFPKLFPTTPATPGPPPLQTFAPGEIPDPDPAIAPQFIPLDLVAYNYRRQLAQQGNNEKKAEKEKFRAANEGLRSILGGDQANISSALHITPEMMENEVLVVISDSYARFVVDGGIKPICGCLDGFSGESSSTIVYSSSKEIEDVDVVVMGTGYTPTSTLQSILSEDLYTELSKKPAENTSDRHGSGPNDYISPFLLYKHCLHPAFKETGGFVGMYKRPYFGVMELQGRLLAQLFSGKSHWPSEETMTSGINSMRKLQDNVNFVEVMESLIEELKLPLNFDSIMDTTGTSLLPIISAVLSPPSDPEVEKTAALVRKYLDRKSTTQLQLTPKAIFRSLQGTWRISRKLMSKIKEYPSGNFTGVANFTPRDPTFFPAPSDGNEGLSCRRPFTTTPPPSTSATSGSIVAEQVYEYLYQESGELVTTTGLKLSGTRKYIYRYNPETDKISVWFVKNSDNTSAAVLVVDYFFHELEFMSPPGDHFYFEGDGIGGEGGWKAKGEHLCERDWYWPCYRFEFGGEWDEDNAEGKVEGNEDEMREEVEGSKRRRVKVRGGCDVVRFWIRYNVKGPEKDYASEGEFTRI